MQQHISELYLGGKPPTLSLFVCAMCRLLLLFLADCLLLVVLFLVVWCCALLYLVVCVCVVVLVLVRERVRVCVCGVTECPVTTFSDFQQGAQGVSASPAPTKTLAVNS